MFSEFVECFLTASGLGRCIRTFQTASGRFHTLNRPWVACMCCVVDPRYTQSTCTLTLLILSSSESQILNFKSVTMLENSLSFVHDEEFVF